MPLRKCLVLGAKVKNIKLTGTTAAAYCENMNLGGYTDWRLPYVEEAFYITDKGKSDPAMSSIFIYDGGDTYNSFWTNTKTKWAGDRWYIDGFHGVASWNPEAVEFRVRCVRGSYDNTNLTKKIEAEEIVIDYKRGLVWQDNELSTPIAWEEAIDYCESLSLTDNNDWRLPNINELFSILDVQVNSTLNEDTFLYYAGEAWASTTNNKFNEHAWFVRLSSYPYISWGEGKTTEKVVKCVRTLD